MTFASDTFDGTEDTTLTVYDAAWVLMTGVTMTAEIASSRARNSSASLSSYRNTASPPSADYPVSASLFVRETTSNRRAGVIGRASAIANSYYLARLVTGTGWQLAKVINGTFTQLGSSVAQSVSADTSYDVKLLMTGTTIELYKLGEGTAAVSATDSALTDAGFAGIYFNSGIASDTQGIHIDTWSAGEAAGGDTIAATAAALSFAGTSANLDESINATAGAVTLSGVQAALTEVVTADPGDVVFSGTTTSIDESVDATAAAVLFSGVQASVEVAGAVEINCTAAAITFAAPQAALVETVFTNTNALAFQGGTAGFTVTLEASAGEVTFEGVQGAVFAPVIVDCTVAVLSFGGGTATIVAGGGPRGRARGRRRQYGTLEPAADTPMVDFIPPEPLPAAERFVSMSELLFELTPVAPTSAPADQKAAKRARNLNALAEILKLI